MKTQWASTSGNAKHCKVNRELSAVHCPRGNPQDTQLPASISMRQLLDLSLFKLPPEGRLYWRLHTGTTCVWQGAPLIPLLANPEPCWRPDLLAWGGRCCTERKSHDHRVIRGLHSLRVMSSHSRLELGTLLNAALPAMMKIQSLPHRTHRARQGMAKLNLDLQTVYKLIEECRVSPNKAPITLAKVRECLPEELTHLEPTIHQWWSGICQAGKVKEKGSRGVEGHIFNQWKGNNSLGRLGVVREWQKQHF